MVTNCSVCYEMVRKELKCNEIDKGLLPATFEFFQNDNSFHYMRGDVISSHARVFRCKKHKRVLSSFPGGPGTQETSRLELRSDPRDAVMKFTSSKSC